MTDRKKEDEAGASPSQYARFVEVARELGCDGSEEAFDEKLKVIARHKPKSAKAMSKESNEAE